MSDEGKGDVPVPPLLAGTTRSLARGAIYASVVDHSEAAREEAPPAVREEPVSHQWPTMPNIPDNWFAGLQLWRKGHCNTSLHTPRSALGSARKRVEGLGSRHGHAGIAISARLVSRCRLCCSAALLPVRKTSFDARVVLIHCF